MGSPMFIRANRGRGTTKGKLLQGFDYHSKLSITATILKQQTDQAAGFLLAAFVMCREGFDVTEFSLVLVGIGAYTGATLK